MEHADSARKIEHLLKRDDLRQRFEAAWRAGIPLSWEHYLGEVPEADRAVLFADLLGVEVELRQARGDEPSAAEYCGRFPEYASQIDAVFREIAVETRDTGPCLAPGVVLGDFRIRRELGRGGMGVVYEAEQLSLERRVALKVLAPHRRVSDEARSRFLREARSAASLHHTSIVPVLEVGEQGGTLFFVMQLIQGRPLNSVLADLRRQGGLENTPAASIGLSSVSTDRCPSNKTPRNSTVHWTLSDATVPPPTAAATGHVQHEATEVCPQPLAGDATAPPERRNGTFWNYGEHAYWRHVGSLGRQVADALQHAHERGVLHRDIKPANLLVAPDGNVWVTDFGLAKVGDSELTDTGDILGTLRYLAPEVIEGGSDVRSDLYSLGLTLYEMLTLRSPFDAQERVELLRQIRRAEIAPCSQLASNVPRDLVTIVSKATHRDPRDRYQTAREMADDLDRYLRDQPILARKHSRTELLVRWARRNPAVAGLASALTLLLILVAIGSAATAVYFRSLVAQQRLLARERESQRQAAEASAARAWTAEQQTLRGVAELQRTQGVRYLQQDDPLRALLSSVRALQQLDGLPSATPDVRELTLDQSLRFRAAALLECLPPVVARRTIDDYDWRQLRFDPAGLVLTSNTPKLQFLAEGELSIVSKLSDVAFRWNPESDALRRMAPLGWTANNSTAASGDAEVPSPASTFFAPSTQYAVGVGPEGHLEVWLCDPERLVCRLESVEEDMGSFAGGWISPDGRWVLAAFARPTASSGILIWDVQTGRRTPTPPLELGVAPPPFGLNVHFSNDGRRVILATNAATVLDLESQTALITAASRVWPRPVFSHCGRFLVVPQGNQVQVRDLDLSPDSPPIAEIPLPLRTMATEVACDTSDRWAIVGTVDGDLYMVDLEERCLAATPLRHSNAQVELLAINPRADVVAAADVHGTLRVWSFPSGMPLTAPLAHEQPVSSLAWRDDGCQLAAVTVSGDLTIWDLSRAIQPPRFDQSAHGMAVSPNGRELLTWERPGQVSVWDFTSRPPRETASLSVPGVQVADWSPDGLQVALVSGSSGQGFCEFRLWRPHDSALTLLDLKKSYLPNLLGPVVGFMDDGEKLAFGGISGPVVFDLAGHSETFRFGAEDSLVSDPMFCAISHRWLVCCRRRMPSCHGGGLQVWTSDGRLAFQAPLPSEETVRRLAFSPDGSRLAVIGDFGLRLWRSGDWQSIPTESLLLESTIERMSFDAGSQYLALVDSNSMCQVASVSDRFHCGPLFQLPRNVHSLSFSPDGKRLAVVTVLDGVAVWDWARGEPLTPAYRRDCRLRQAVFSPDGTTLALLHFPSGLEWLPIPPATAVSYRELEQQVQTTSGYELSPDNEVRRLPAARWKQLGPGQHPAGDIEVR